MPHDESNELFYWVDEQDHIKGRISRAEAHSGSMLLHRAVVIVLYDPPKKQILMQKRSDTKDMDPGKWTNAVGGHVTAGDTYRQTVRKELMEEIGVEAVTKFSHKTIWRGSKELEMVSVYTGFVTHLPTKLDETEVAEVRFVPISDMLKFIETNEVTELCRQVMQELGILGKAE